MTGSALPRRPGLRRADDAFFLAPEIPMDGAIKLADAFERLTTDWRKQVDDDQVDERTVDTYRRVARTLIRYLTRADVVHVCDITSELVWQWVNSPATGTRKAEYPSQNIRKLRRATVVAIYRTWYRLGITERNIGASLPSVTAVARVVSALTATQIQALKDYADYETDGSTYETGYSRTPACLALVLIGAQPGEVGAIRVRDIDQLEKAVFLHGGGTRYRERWVPIDDTWAWQALLERLAYLHTKHPNDPETLLAYRPNSPGTSNFSKRSAATSMTLSKLMKAAGVYRAGKTRVASIHEYVAGRIFNDTERVEAVAARLGLGSLDSAAHLVGYQWREPFDPDPRGQR